MTIKKLALLDQRTVVLSDAIHVLEHEAECTMNMIDRMYLCEAVRILRMKRLETLERVHELEEELEGAKA